MGKELTKTVKQYDKRVGITYVYENESYWCKVKKQPRSKRKIIGRLDPETNEVVPTRGRGRARSKGECKTKEIHMEVYPTHRRYFYGLTYLFDQICDKIGLLDDLKTCFPDTYKQILSIAYYSIAEQNSAMYRFEKWSNLNKHPYGKDISSQRSSELFASITEDSKFKFFKLQGRLRIENEFCGYDITSISSFSQVLKQVLYGHNKENDPLPQINIALVFGEESELPFYYRKLAGNTPDSKTLPNLLADLSILEFNNLKMVKDRGFYTESNINELYKRKVKFLVGAKKSTLFIRGEIDKVRDEIESFENYSLSHKCFGYATSTKWEYTNESGTTKEKKQMYVYIYYNKERAAEAEQKLTVTLANLYNELKSGKRIDKNKKLYEKYFKIFEKGKEIQIVPKKDVINEQIKYAGYFVYVSNLKMDIWDARHKYLRKDVVEKAFNNYKDRLGGRRNLVSSEQTLDGKLFVLFIALIIMSYINKQMNKNNIYVDYTMQQVMDKLEIIECFENEGKKTRVGEVTEKQKKLYEDLGVKPVA